MCWRVGRASTAYQTLMQEIRLTHAQSRQTYDTPRIVKELRKKGRRHGRKRIGRLMKAAGLCGRQKRRYRVQTTDRRHDHPIVPNRLAQVPKATAPNQFWVADIPILKLRKAGFIWPPSWISTAARLSAEP